MGSHIVPKIIAGVDPSLKGRRGVPKMFDTKLVAVRLPGSVYFFINCHSPT